MQAGVITFPGSNCDRDVAVALEAAGAGVTKLWHADPELPRLDLIVLPGGFSYGDYLRSGAIASKAPIMTEVVRAAEAGVAVLGICNGFQLLAEAGLVPGALIANARLKFVCKEVELDVVSINSIFTTMYDPTRPISIPIAHHDGNYVCDEDELKRLQDEDRIALRYRDNPNGSTDDIAGVLGPGRNVLGLMPHPERAVDPRNRRHRWQAHVPRPDGGAGMSVRVEPITPELIAEHGLSDDEYKLILEILDRPPSVVELGIFSVMWSEHCSYKSSKHWLSKLPTEAPWVICGPGENAGIVDVGGGMAAVFKAESHNHPSFIEPYQGAATGVGGILRDIFTMGARPVALLNALRFGSPDHPKDPASRRRRGRRHRRLR